jgi:methylmalonyl-CoA/ethylmalonyl-CoA epimerase
MSNINNTIAALEFAQIGWVVPDIHATVKFLSGALGIAGFPEPEHVSAQDLNCANKAMRLSAKWITLLRG